MANRIYAQGLTHKSYENVVPTLLLSLSYAREEVGHLSRMIHHTVWWYVSRDSRPTAHEYETPISDLMSQTLIAESGLCVYCVSAPEPPGRGRA